MGSLPHPRSRGEAPRAPLRGPGAGPLHRAAVLGLLVLAITACSSDSDSDGGAPDPATVFDTLPAPTPNKLRGVWAMGEPDKTRHLRFTDGYIVGATRCIAPDKSRSLLAGGSAKLETSSLDAKQGSFTTASLSGRKQDGDLSCDISVAGNTYDFVINELSLTLSVTNTSGTTLLTKVGD